METCSGELVTALREPIQTLRAALRAVKSAYQSPIPSLLPRPALILVGHVASALLLLEHASWSHTKNLVDSSLDAEVFSQWVLEAGLDAALSEVTRAQSAKKKREVMNSHLVFGSCEDLRSSPAKL